MLCQHGYTAFYDCPQCLCPSCGRPEADCRGHEDEAAERLLDLERARLAAGEVA